MHSLHKSIGDELCSVQERLNKEIVFKTARFHDLVNLTMDEMDKCACPAILLAVSRSCGYRGGKSIGLASAIELVYMAGKVHRLMRDEGISEEERQYPVLVGDFLFGKYFLMLCQEGLLKYLAPLAQAIAGMSEGSIERWRLQKQRELLKDEWIMVLGREHACLTAMAARLGADLAEMPLDIQTKLEMIGWNLGLAWAAAREKLEVSIIKNALEKALTFIRELPDSLHIIYIKELYSYFALKCCPDYC